MIVDFITPLRAIIKSLVFASLAIAYMASGLLLQMVTWNRTVERERALGLTQFFARLGARLIGLKVHVKGISPTTKPCLYVANHLSYTDILAMFTFCRPVFVTSTEIRNTPFLGWLCRIAGCYFVERRNRSKIDQEIRHLAATLEEGFSIGLFPEGTTSDGHEVLPFKRSLFRAAILAGAPVQPLCIQYLRIDGTPVDTANRDEIFWYGDMTFGPHLWNLFKKKRVDLNITTMQPIQTSLETRREQLAHEAFRLVSQGYQGLPTEPPGDLKTRVSDSCRWEGQEPESPLLHQTHRAPPPPALPSKPLQC